jgi:hypothetical protein
MHEESGGRRLATGFKEVELSEPQLKIDATPHHDT